jgi:hypothetical protein
MPPRESLHQSSGSATLQGGFSDGSFMNSQAQQLWTITDTYLLFAAAGFKRRHMKTKGSSSDFPRSVSGDAEGRDPLPVFLPGNGVHR